MSKRILQRLIPSAASFALLIVAVPANGQAFLSSSSGSTGGTSNTGSSLGSSSSGSSFGSSSGSNSAGGFLGTSSLSSTGNSSTGVGVMSTTGSTGSRTGTGSATVPGSTTFLGQSFVNPLALGFSGLTTFAKSSANPSVIKTSQFGTPLFTITPITNPIGGNTTGRSGTTGTATVTPIKPAMPYAASTYGMRRAPSYVTEPRFSSPPLTLRAIEGDVRGAIARASELQAPGNAVNVQMDGPVVVLRGVVTNMDQMHLAEDVIRLTPGVQTVRNELTVQTAQAR